jgi:predicted nucleotidyltransferase component of viral defense system
MDKRTAEELSKKIQISMDCLVREEYEMIFLKEIGESEFSTNLIFKGGTALRLAYHSPRFSEDLDFNLLGEVHAINFLQFLTKVGKKYPGITDIETVEKFYTIFGIAKIQVPYLDRPISLKIEVSKRKNKQWVRDKDFHDVLIMSEVTPLTILARVASIEVIINEKKDALKNRNVARDVFDYWYIQQMLKKDIKPDFTGFDTGAAKSELHRLLPKPYWRLIDVWLE